MKYKYKNVVVERIYMFMPLTEEALIGYINFDREFVKINISNPRLTSDGLAVDIESPQNLIGYTPAINYKALRTTHDGRIIDGIITGIGFSAFPNADPLIKPISNENVQA